MEAIFLKLIEQLNSAVMILILILVIAFWAVYKISSIVTLFGGFKEERRETKEDIREMRKDLSKISGTVDLLYQKYLPTVQSQSPLSLTPKGKEISAALKIEEKVSNHWDVIKEKTERKSPSNPYDIQSVAMELARDCFDIIFSEQEKDEIKLYAYQKGVNLLEIVPIIGVLVRDKYLKEKGITAEEIDRHSP